MKNKMKALVAYAPFDYRLEEMDIPKAGPKELVLKVEGCGVCAGDIKSYHGAPSFWGGEGNPPYIKAPMVPGHEFIGVVVDRGEGVTDFVVGDRVASEQIVPCGECRFCKTGRHWMCQKHDLYGFQNNVNGAMAEYIKLPKEALNYHVPKSLPLKKAILIEPFSCSKHAVDRANISNEDVVVLAGAGTLGLGMVGAIRLRNPKTLIVLDFKQNRLDLAKKFGADIVLNPQKEDVHKIVMDLTDGYGCDVYIEATGHPKAVNQGLEMIRKMGTFVEFSVFNELVTVDWSIISDRKELDVLGAHLSPYCYDTVIEWISDGKLPTDGVVTHTFKLEQWKEAFDLAESGKDDALKIVLVP